MPRLKSRSLPLFLRLTSALTAASVLTSPAFALPSGGQVVGGQASIASSGSQTTITQATDRGIIHWQTFDIAHGEHVRFQQPSASSVTLNRVTGGQGASQILGQLSANGTVMLVNPNGVIFGPTSQVNVGSLVATTSDVADDRFLAGDYRFDKPGNPNAGVLNQGHVTVAEAGLAAFVAPNIVNEGIIEARLGTIELASGDRFTLDLYGDGLIHLEASDAVQSQLVSNSGILSASGGTVRLTAAAAGEVVNSLINTDGIIAATAIAEQDGEIVIFAEGANAVAGNDPAQKAKKQGSSTVLVSGVLDVSGRKVGERGGKLTVTGDNVALLNGTLIDARGHTGLSGTTAGKAVSAYRDGSAGGDIRIGGDYLGQGNTPTAQNLYVDPGALILNDSLFTGDAGRTIFWSDGTTRFYGNVYARGLGGLGVDTITWGATAGGNPGDGGFVETSGYQHLDAGGYVDLTASSGEKGTYFLDPTDITIYGNVDPTFQSTDGSINLGSSLRLWLDASDLSRVTLTYSTDGLSGATATGTAGSNTITTSANVSANLAVGARIRLGAAGAVTTAQTLGADTYTIASISGTTITLAENLTQSYSGSTLHRGLVSQLADKSGQGNSATQATAANMPLWVSNGQNGLGTMLFTGSQDRLDAQSSFALQQSFNAVRTDATANRYASIVGNTSSDFGNVRLSDFPATLTYGHNNGNDLGPNANYYVNDALGRTYTIGESHIVSVSGTTPYTYNRFRLGANATGSRSWGGLISESIGYSSTVSTTARILVSQYQSARWGVALTPPGTGATEVAKATASDGYSSFTTRYLERLSQSANISLQATNNITLDLKGDTLSFATAGRSLTLTAGNQITTASAGAITTNNGAISLTATNGILLGHALDLNSNGANIALNNNVTLGGNTTINAGSGALAFGGTVNGGHNLTATAGTLAFGGGLGGVTPLGAVSLTSTNGLTLPSITASSILARTTGATSDLALAAGRTISASGSGNAITLASGRNFLNAAGGGAFNLTGGGRFLVYSADPVADTSGGLASDFRRFSCSYGGSCPNFPATGNGFLYNATPVLTATPTGISLTFGDAAPTLTGYSYSLSGYLGGDASADSVTGSLTGTTPYTQGSNVGSYAVNYASGSLASAIGYGFSYANSASAITVSPKRPSIAPAEASRVQFIRPRYEPLPPVRADSTTPAAWDAPRTASQAVGEPLPPELAPASDGIPETNARSKRPHILVDPELQLTLDLPDRL